MQNSASTVSKKTYQVILDKDEDGIIFARCNELHANAEGRTETEAKNNIKESIELMIEEMNKDKGYSLKFIRKYSD
ncbi:MAG TPA: type II toxin-antitoxin system HicB family antitoxin [Candidatus Nitrosotalea sp.]|nr:type II toxin-antitoxin system HicB family antitoxin [Candidatus Nitrosotalea sp.]